MRNALLSLLLLTLAGTAAAQPLPALQIDLELKAFHGHELGYGRPREGSHLRFRLDRLGDLEKLDFVPLTEYVPLPVPLTVVDVDQKGASWRSLRARSGDDRHRVTFDLERHGAGNQVRGWILIESGERIRGLLYLEGTAGFK